MSREIERYQKQISDILAQIVLEEDSIRKGAQVIAEAVQKGKMVHVIGPGGHSNMGVEEILWRAGGMAFWNAILDPGTNLIHGAKRSNLIERTPGYAKGVLDAYRVGWEEGEVMVIVNAYGINSMTIDTVLECQKRHVFTIGVTSSEFASTVPKGHKARHPSGLNLYETADIYINNHLPLGDAVVEIEGMEQKTGSTSTFCNCFVMNCLVIETAKVMISMGMKPPVFMSANMPGGDEANRELEELYIPKIKHLQ